MKKHLALVCLAYAALGVSTTIRAIVVEAGLGLYPIIITYVACTLFFILIMFTSMQKLKEFISNAENK